MFALFATHSIEEVEPLVLRYQVAAKAQSKKEGEGVCLLELNSLLWSARLHEVMCHCTPRLKIPYHSSIITSSTAIQRLTVTGRTAPERRHMHLLKPGALCRHAGSLKRPRGRCALCST